MKIRIESDDLIIEIEGDSSIDYISSTATALGQTALNLFVKGLAEIREKDNTSASET